MAAMFAGAGIPGAVIETRSGRAQFPSINAWVHSDAKGWTLADLIDDEQYAALREAAMRELVRFATPDGGVSFAALGHIITAARP
jgi:hypothetical protein